MSKWLLTAMALLVAGCSTGKVVILPGSGDHPADPETSVPAFKPAPDPLFAAGPPNTVPEFAMPMEESGGHGGHENHGEQAPEGKSSHDGNHVGGKSAAPTPESHREGGKHEGQEGPDRAHEKSATTGAVVAAEDRVVLEYLALVQALSQDDFPSAGAALKRVSPHAEELARVAEGNLASAAKNLEDLIPKDPKSIEDARGGLKRLSEALTNLVRLSPPSHDAAPQLRKVYCPMADASWLQVGTEVANPYFGAKMLRCGRVIEVIESRPAGGEK